MKATVKKISRQCDNKDLCKGQHSFIYLFIYYFFFWGGGGGHSDKAHHQQKLGQHLFLLCGLHEVYSHIMELPDLFLIYLFVYESRASVAWSSVVVLVVSLGSSNFF